MSYLALRYGNFRAFTPPPAIAAGSPPHSPKAEPTL